MTQKSRLSVCVLSEMSEGKQKKKKKTKKAQIYTCDKKKIPSSDKSIDDKIKIDPYLFRDEKRIFCGIIESRRIADKKIMIYIYTHTHVRKMATDDSMFS